MGQRAGNNLFRWALSWVILFLGGHVSQPGWAQPPEAIKEKITTPYLRQLEPSRQESWFRRELRRFRTYPHLHRAYRLMSQNKYPEAQAELEKLLTIDPLDLEARYAYLTILYKTKQFQAVIDQASRILGRAPAFVPARLYQGLAYQALGDTHRAIAAFRQAVETPAITPADKTFALRMLSDLYITKGDYSQALEVIRGEAPAAPDFAFYYRQGQALQGLGRWSEAHQALAQAEKLAHNHQERLQALLALAEVNKKRQEWTKVRQAYEAALSLDPDNPVVLRGLAQAAYNQKDYPAAIAAIRQALSRQDNPDDRLFLANLLEALKQHDQQIGELKALLATEPPPETRYRLLMALGQAYSKVGDHNRAAQTFAQAAHLRPEAESLLALANAQEKAGHHQAAIDTLKNLVKIKPEAALHFRLAVLYDKSGHPKMALAQVEQALKMGLPPEHLIPAYLLQAKAYQQLGEVQKAAQVLQQAARARPQDATLLASLVEVALKQADTQQALYYLDQLAARETEPSKRINLLVRRGHLLAQLGRHQDAVAAFRQALALKGDDPQLHLDVAFSLFNLKRYAEARDHFRQAWEKRPDLSALLGLARCYQAMGKTGLAIHFYESALPLVHQAPAPTQQDIYNNLGYLYAHENQYDKAARSWQKSLTLGYDAVIALRLARMLRLQQHNQEAAKLLKQIPPDQLPTNLQADRWEELGRVLWALNQGPQALEALKQAQQLEASPARAYLLGLYHLKMRQPQEALPFLKDAVAQEPRNPTYRETLGYAWSAVRDYPQAAAEFETVLRLDPDYPKLYEDLGYAHLKAVNNDQAVKWFQRAIDYHKRYGPDLDLTTQQQRQEIYRLKKEVHKLSNRLDFTAYMGFRSDRRQQSVPLGLIGGGALPSQGGLEVAWQPPVVGFRNERQLQIFHRVLWNVKPRSLRIDGDSFQGGVGIRYKPLRLVNFWTWAERLYQIGLHSRDNWLLRLLCSWDLGYDLKPARPWWNYTFLYGDVAYFTRHPDTWTYYAEARQGLTFNYRDTLLFTPHVIADWRYQDPWLATSSYAEAGLGISLKYLLWETAYESHHGSLEILAHFKSGRFLNKGGGFSGDTLNGWFVTGIWSF